MAIAGCGGATGTVEVGAMTQRPKPPLTVIALSLVVLAGLVALFLAAQHAFSTVAGREQAIAAALLIEVGTVAEALAFARSRNRIAGAGLLISFLVSASYNYTQAHDARPELAGFQLLALALGPLSALTFVSLALGAELRTWGLQVKEQEVEEDERRRCVVERREAKEREELEYRRREERLVVRRLERWERREGVRSVTEPDVVGRSVDRRWPDKAAFLADDDRLDDLSARALADAQGICERSARRWLAAVRNGRDEVG